MKIKASIVINLHVPIYWLSLESLCSPDFLLIDVHYEFIERNCAFVDTLRLKCMYIIIP